MTTADFSIQNEGSIVLLHLHTEPARAWAADHLPEDAERFGQAVVIEWRFAADIVHAMVADGLVIG